jgi:hypothetical protein
MREDEKLVKIAEFENGFDAEHHWIAMKLLNE